MVHDSCVYTQKRQRGECLQVCAASCVISLWQSDSSPAPLMGPLYCAVATGVDCINKVVYNLVKVLKVGQSRINTTHIRVFKIIFYINIYIYYCFPLTLDLLHDRRWEGSAWAGHDGNVLCFFHGQGGNHKDELLANPPLWLPRTWYSLVWPPWRHQGRVNNNRNAPVHWVGPVPGENTLHVLTGYSQEGFPPPTPNT